jgi:arylsulfatase A
VTSDNGCAPYAGIAEMIQKGHHPSCHFRGAKADIYEGGHHIPFIARWKGVVAPGSKHDHTIFLGDLMATCAEIIRFKLPDTAAEDSFSFLSVLRGDKATPARPAVVHHSARGTFAIRDGRWKLIFGPGSGGWSDPRPGEEPPDAIPVQLYDLESDIGERKNLADQNPEEVTRLTLLFEKYIADGRSTPGAVQANAVPIEIWKNPRPAANAR